MVKTTGSLSASTSSAGQFFGRGLPDLALFESPVHRRLAVADLVIALFCDMGSPSFHPARRGRHRRPIATAKFRTI